MCGVIGIVGNKPVAKRLVDCLRKLEYRGYDSMGVALIGDDGLVVKKDVGCVADVVARLGIEELGGNIGIGHSRWATHGGVTQKNAHPHCDCHHKIAVIHNGVIDNYLEIKRSLDNHKFESETDSEIIAHLIEDAMSGGDDLLKAVLKLPSIIKGDYAIIAMSVGDKRLVGIRHGCPLVAARADGGCFIASDPLALSEYATQMMYLEDGEVAVLDESSVLVYDFNGNSIGKSENRLATVLGLTGGLEDRMGYEIDEQPEVILNAINQDKEYYMNVAIGILRSQHVLFVASGSSRFASLVGRYVFSTIAKKLCEVVVASEFENFVDSVDKGTVVIAPSQSGETSDVLRAIEVAKHNGAKIVSFVNTPYSSLWRMSDYVVPLNCGYEVGVAATKSFMAQLVTLYLMALSMENKYDEGKQKLASIAIKVQKQIGVDRGRLMSLAKTIKSKHAIYYIARGISFPIACEGALKMKEISYIHTDGLPAGELKHGSLALIENGTPVVAICPRDDTYDAMIANVHEAKARGAFVIGVSDTPCDAFTEFLSVPMVEPVFSPLLTIIPMQVLAYYVALAKRLNPDRPRNLAKSVTVK